jgi:cytochrome c oxidase subunit 2
MINIAQLEKRIICVSVAFVMVLLGLAALAINIFHVGLPTCLTDIKPFQKGELIIHSPTHYELHYVARMWRFEPQDVTVPAGSTVDVYLSAADVTHGMIMPGTDLNLMAIPGVVNYSRVKFDRPHVYQVLCHEFCGAGHQSMAATLHVVDMATFRAMRFKPQPGGPSAEQPVAQLLETKGCTACHSLDGSPGIGPTFKGAYGRTQKMTDGSTVTVDENYLRESIVDPDEKIVAGFDPLMPKTPLTDKEIKEIVDYLKTLK